MVEDATLNEFHSVEDDPPIDDTAEPEVRPATPTYVYLPRGVACDACGTVTQRRWTVDGDLLCPSCVEW
ncbi:DUF7573 domain-containing protein [Halorhabdus salina]